MGLFVTNVHTAKACKGHTVGTGQVRALSVWAFDTPDVVNVKRLVITAGAGVIRITWDGTAPTSVLGRYLAAYETVTLDGTTNCQNFKAISVAADSVVTITLEV
jgi:hypothetical protein